MMKGLASVSGYGSVDKFVNKKLKYDITSAWRLKWAKEHSYEVMKL
jgi:hypothetical protein